MLLVIFDFFMKFADISKMQGKRIINNNNKNNNEFDNNSKYYNINNNNSSNNNDNNNHFKNEQFNLVRDNMNKNRWQHVSKTNVSNSSSSSSGCESGTTSSSSSKENNMRPHILTPQQLQQMGYYQQLQQQQLQLLHEQLLQRKQLQEQLQQHGLEVGRSVAETTKTTKTTTTTAGVMTLTCNQQYLRQMRLQQQQQQPFNVKLQDQQRVDNYIFHTTTTNKTNTKYNFNDILNNNSNDNNNTNNISYSQSFKNVENCDHRADAAFIKGQKIVRGMTEFSINNDLTNNTSHLSFHLPQNSPRHHFIGPSTPSLQSTAGSTVTPIKPNSTILPQHLAQLSKNLLETHKQTLINHKNNQQTLNIDKQHSPSSVTSSTTHSPTHYRNPFNSPNNSPFSYNNTTYANNSNNSKRQQQQQQQQQQQHRNHRPQQQQLRQSGCKIPLLTYNQYQQHLNDLLLQQQHLAKHQRKLLQAKDSDNEELSEESLKQNVAIVLNNLNRYNNALRSIILSEHINSAGNVFYEETDLNIVGGAGGAGGVGDGVGVSGVRNCEEEGSIVNNNLLCNMAAATTPESDYNSNATTPGSRTGMLTYDNGSLHHGQHLVGFSNVGGGGGVFNNIVGNGGGGNNAFLSNNLSCSLASAADFTHDNSDYQWFLDCGYRDGYNGMQRSVLSSLAASYNGLGDFIYEDMSKHLDANLAQADIESFRTKDIQLLLSQLPSYCKNLSGSRLQQSLILQQHINSQQLLQQQNISQTSTSSTNDLIDNSICKSELLFSPVKESHISVDSMDLDAYPEDDEIILTYKANKDNYTIAFEGSVLYSDDSFYEPNEIALKNTQNFINLHTNLDDIVKRKSLEVSMSRSEQPPVSSYNGLQKNSHIKQLQRYPSGNNNTAETITIIRPPLSAAHCSGVRKCSSLPNLSSGKHFLVVSHIKTNNLEETKDVRQQKKLNVSQAISTSNVEPNLCARVHNLLPMCQMPISCNSISGSIEDHLHLEGQTQQQQLSVHDGGKNAQHGHRSHKHRCCCVMINNQTSGSGNVSLSASGTQGSQNAKQTHISASASSGSSNVPAFNLVKLFIKQKSSNCSLEDPNNTQTCMDVSSGCWPSSEMNGFSSNSSIEQLSRKKSMHDSGKGSGLSRHDEEEADCNSSTFQIDTAASTPKRPSCSRGTYYDEDGSTNSSGSITATNSPTHPSGKSMPLRNPTLCHLTNEHNSHSSGSLQSSDKNSDQLTQVFKTSVMSSSSNTHDQQNIGERTTRNVDENQHERISHVSSSEMITRSMQTSCGSLSTRSSLSDRFRCVPPSFLEKLHNLGEECQAPIYVIYPNYALPDLGFVKHSTTPDVIFSPFNYKMTIGGAASSRGSSTSSLKKRCNLLGGNEENEILKTVDYKHVVDWVSLATLLPADYRRRLKHISEVKVVLNRLETELSHKPLFCLTPAIRRNRPHICDCAQYFQRDQQTEGAGSSSSGSSHQPSSGYRGSSTVLTDSDFEENATVNTVGGDSRSDALKQMYVYQYEQQRMEGGVEDSAKVQTNTPLPMPRGILRKSSSGARNKRNSMVEPGQGCSKLNKVEKRRSLQEPPYRQHIGSAEELTEVFEEECFEIGPNLDKKSQRLSRKDLDARIRAENFLSSLPRHELKYYVEIAAILESSEQYVQYDAAALKKEVSRALSQQKKVSFNDNDNDKNRQQDTGAQVITTLQQLPQMDAKQRFSTPPNSPNISVGVTARGGRLSNDGITRPCSNREETAEKRKQEKNRFKRMQIQWELMSKDSSMLKELESIHQTKSGATTPTSAAVAVPKSRIPRPVSYPAGKGPFDKNKTHSDNVNTIKPQKLSAVSPQTDRLPNQGENSSKMTKSPSRIVPPKHYRMMTIPLSTPNTPTITTGGRARTLNSRAAVTAPNTPKKRMQSPRTLPRIR